MLMKVWRVNYDVLDDPYGRVVIGDFVSSQW